MNWKNKLIAILATLTMVLSFQNCGKPSELQYASTVEMNSKLGIQDSSIFILQKHCSDCHSDTVVSGNVGDITDVNLLIYSRVVIPGEPELSPLIVSITSGAMPSGREPLTAAEVDILKTWIKDLNKTGPVNGGDITNTTPAVEAKYSSVYQQIISPRCIACHANRNYRLNSYNEVMRTVTSGNAAGSILYQAITTGRTGGKMPQGGALSSNQVKAIQDWINSGAPNN